jgi:hypothetical protein
MPDYGGDDRGLYCLELQFVRDDAT